MPGASSAFVQTYGYDSLNRLQSAEETIGAASNWKQVYSYDRYGNRTLAAGTSYPTTLDSTNNPVGQSVQQPHHQHRLLLRLCGQPLVRPRPSMYTVSYLHSLLYL